MRAGGASVAPAHCKRFYNFPSSVSFITRERGGRGGDWGRAEGRRSGGTEGGRRDGGREERQEEGREGGEGGRDVGARSPALCPVAASSSPSPKPGVGGSRGPSPSSPHALSGRGLDSALCPVADRPDSADRARPDQPQSAGSENACRPVPSTGGAGPRAP